MKKAESTKIGKVIQEYMRLISHCCVNVVSEREARVYLLGSELLISIARYLVVHIGI